MVDTRVRPRSTAAVRTYKSRHRVTATEKRAGSSACCASPRFRASCRDSMPGRLHHIDRIVFRRTQGRETFTSWVTGLPIVMLTTTGAKSGSRRTPPRDRNPSRRSTRGYRVGLRRRHNPAWYHNLRAYPGASVFVDGASRDVVACELTGDERERWCARGIGIYPGWRYYRKRAKPRQIPVVELRPALPDDNSTGRRLSHKPAALYEIHKRAIRRFQETSCAAT